MSNVDGVTTSRSRVPSQGALAVTAAFLLGFSALLTAWSAYREASTSDQVIRTYAQMQETIARVFLQFAIEAGTGNEDAADYLLTVMDDAMYEAVLWWSDIPDEDRPATPFTDDNPYVADLFSEELLSEGDALMDEADELRLTAEEAEATSDRYNLANVFFAVVLFIAGLTTIIQRRSIQVSFLSVSILGLTSGLVLLALTPGWFSLA